MAALEEDGDIPWPAGLDRANLDKDRGKFVAQMRSENSELRATPMQLLVKNNLTVIDAIDLEGYGTSGLLALTDVKKRMLAP